MVDLQLRMVTPLKWHCATKCMLYVHIHCVFCEQASKGNASLIVLKCSNKNHAHEAIPT